MYSIIMPSVYIQVAVCPIVVKMGIPRFNEQERDCTDCKFCMA